MVRVLLTGVTGFLGSVTLAELLLRGRVQYGVEPG
jgi:thioester reductase-like protein